MIAARKARGRDLPAEGTPTSRKLARIMGGVMRFSRIPPLLLVAMIAAAGCEGDRGRGEAPRNVLLITLDTLRADRLGCYGYAAARTPHLDALAARGVRFLQATSVAPLTLPAHSSLMTGTYPAAHGVRDNGGFYLGEEHRTLAEALAGRGFRTGGFVGSFVLDSRWGIAQGFEHFFDDFDLTEFEEAPGMDAIQRPGSEVVDRAIGWLAAEDERPFFAWVHLYDPHTPYEAPEPHRSDFPATRSGAYDAEVAWTDELVGRLLSALEERGRLAETLVVVLGDHGEMLGEHDEVTHGFFIYDAALRIPMILAGPGLAPAEVAAQVRIVDVMPTVLSRLGIPVPDGVQGVDLAPVAAGRGPPLIALAESWFPRFHYGWSELASIQDGRYKLIRAPRRELYDLDADPGELTNLAAREPELADRMEAALGRLLDELSRGEATAPRPVDEATARRLEALGYLASSSSRRHLEDAALGDPKDKIGLYNLLKEASAASAAGNLARAVATVTEALARDPGIVEAHLLLGNFERKREAFDEAAAAYRRALELDPEYREAIYGLALTYKKLGRLEEALTGLERATALDPKNGKVLWEIADTLMRQGRFTAAERRLEAALDLDLDRPRFLLKLAECALELDRPAEAEARLRAALAESPRLRLGHYTLGLALEEQGRPADAIAAYERELERNPDAFRAAFNQAKLLLAAGDARAAAERFRQTVELRPELGAGYLYMAKALLDLGDLAAAEEAARTGLDRQPPRDLAPLGHYVLADVYNRLGRTADARREAEAAGRLRGSGPSSE